jgi:hypothetical protein
MSSPSGSFADATSVAQDPDQGAYLWTVPDGWQQGRGAWGGLPIGAMINAVMRTESDAARSLRTVSVTLSAPALPGPHTITVDPVRIGSGVSTWAARIIDSTGGFVGGGSFVTGSPRAGADGRDESTWSAVAAPTAPPWQDVPVASTPPPFPRFTQQLDFRVATGIPLQGGQPETTGWISYRTPTPWTDASIVALSDAWYTVTIVALTELLPISTVSFTASLLIDPAELAPEVPLLHHGLISAAHEGFASEQRRLWSADGRLVVDSLQTLVVG